MFLKIHRELGGGQVVAVCDSELLGKTLTEGDIEITVTRDFYGDTPASEEEVRHALTHAGNANIIGTQVVEIAISLGCIKRSSCLMIGSVPHAQFIQ
ncbi:DUF424 domain-containing protein [Methanocalculus taiwanensis]|uniref:DUF424 domain-containing protein n=1 Tax=Methanocalculus taiwanensis TaxID=106207 RepID=A0ABD4TJ69_9EURY|nr:DUF424 domain-containing protein [Methanocalculus taiwanensis]MCQ1538977.1 DUF424 domain-containing protein [Methanocalculus taiwanensis]